MKDLKTILEEALQAPGVKVPFNPRTDEVETVLINFKDETALVRAIHAGIGISHLISYGKE